MAVTLQVRQRGTLTLPAKLRAKYKIEEGDVFTLIDLDGVLVLSPRVSIVPKLVGEIERLREASGQTVEDLIKGLDEQRERIHQERTADA